MLVQRRWLWPAAVFLTLLFGSVTAAQDDSVELTFPLEQGKYYSLNQARRELKQKLGLNYPVRQETDEQMVLGKADVLALRVAQAAGLLRVDMKPDRLVLTIPKKRDSSLDLGEIFAVDWGLQVPPDFDPRRRTVVLIHGLESGPYALRELAKAFRSKGIQTLFFEYPNDGPIGASGERLGRNLRQLAAKHPGFRCAVVAHSMGGLVARYCLEVPGHNPGCISVLVTLGTPHHGTQLATVQPLLEVAGQLLPRTWFSGWNMVSDGKGEAAAELLPGSDFLNSLNQRERPPMVDYHVGIGTRGLFDADQQERVGQDLDQTMESLNLEPSQRATAHRLIRADELQTGKGDGAVSVESASLRGAKSSQRFGLTHLELIQVPSSRPEDSEVFRWIMDRWLGPVPRSAREAPRP